MLADPPLTNNDQKKPWSFPVPAFVCCAALNKNANADPTSKPFLNSFCSFIFLPSFVFCFFGCTSRLPSSAPAPNGGNSKSRSVSSRFVEKYGAIETGSDGANGQWQERIKNFS